MPDDQDVWVEKVTRGEEPPHQIHNFSSSTSFSFRSSERKL